MTSGDVDGSSFEPILTDGTETCGRLCASDTADDCQSPEHYHRDLFMDENSTIARRPWRTVDTSTTLPFICHYSCK